MVENILRIQQVQARTGLSRSGIYQKISEGTFPSQIPLGKRAIGFSESSISLWVSEQIKKAATHNDPIYQEAKKPDK